MPKPPKTSDDNVQTLEVPGSNIEIPSRYANSGVHQGWDPTPVQRLRLWITGFPGEGKTNFLMSNPEALVFDFEDSARDVVKPKAHVVHITSIDQFLKIHKMLISDGQSDSRVWSHVGFDTIDRLRDMADKWLAVNHPEAIRWNTEYEKRPLEAFVDYKEFGRNGYVRLSDWLLNKLNELYAVGYGCSVSGHIKTVTPIDAPSFTRPVLSDSIIGPLYRWAQFEGHCIMDTSEEEVPTGKTKRVVIGKGRTREKPITRKVKSTRVYLQVNPMGGATPEGQPTRETKARYIEYLPDEILLPLHGGHQAFSDAYYAAIAKARESLSTTPTPKEAA